MFASLYRVCLCLDFPRLEGFQNRLRAFGKEARLQNIFSFKSKMSSTPVPRRESPWGLPDGDTRQPRAHRCNDRAEDIVQACFEGNPFKTVPGPFKLFWRCMRSKPGEEPIEPFYYLQLDPPKREEVKLE